tara:strand:- start:20892 stop:21164 length:273 start_codon:yes stop_codon:yes gene_type:complete
MKVTTTKTETIEVELPLYFELYNRKYKVINEKHCISICNDAYDGEFAKPAIEVLVLAGLGTYIEFIKPISKDAFHLAYIQAEIKLNDLRK